jgi:hypothetical protein
MATPPVFTAGQVLTAAQMNLVGWWKITTATFSATSAVNVDNVFTSDYRNYAIVLEYTTSSTNNLQMQLRVGGVSAATNYNIQAFNASSTVLTGSRSASTTVVNVGYSTNGSFTSTALVYVFRPQLAEPTDFTVLGGENFGAYTVPIIRYDHANHSASTAYDGFGLIVAGGQTTTGRYIVYGMKP